MAPSQNIKPMRKKPTGGQKYHWHKLWIYITSGM